jgi:hypothetical protein
MTSFARRLVLFFVLSGAHLLAFSACRQLPDAFCGAVAFVSWLPWIPLAWLGLPVTMSVIPIPNLAGDVWCVAVWLTIYWWLSGAVARHWPSGKADASSAA